MSCSFLWQRWARKQCTDALTITVLEEKEHMTKIKYDKGEWHMTKTKWWWTDIRSTVNNGTKIRQKCGTEILKELLPITEEDPLQKQSWDRTKSVYTLFNKSLDLNKGTQKN